MKRLILMRHAKSSWDDPECVDHERPLNARGRRAATLMGRWLAARSYLPDLALVSDSARTEETWARVTAAAGPLDVIYSRSLYDAPVDTLLRAIGAAPAVGTLMLLGHQPGIGAAAARFLGDAPADPEFTKFPTAAVAVIDLPAEDWGGVAWGTGQLAEFAVPRRLE